MILNCTVVNDVMSCVFLDKRVAMCGYTEDGSCVVGSLEKRTCGFLAHHSRLDNIPNFWGCWHSVTVCVPVCRSSLLCHPISGVRTTTVPISKFLSVSGGVLVLSARVF